MCSSTIVVQQIAGITTLLTLAAVTVQAQAVRFNDPLPKATLHMGAHFEFLESQRRGRILNDYETAWGRFQASTYVLGILDDLADRLAAQAESEVVGNRARDGSIPPRLADAQSQPLVKTIRALRGGTSPVPDVDPVETLAKSVFFIGLPANEEHRIAAKMRPQTIPDYQFIPASDPQGQSMFVIARGIVQGSQPDQGRDGPVELWGPGDIFGNTSTIGRDATATHNRAMSPCFIFRLRVRDLEGLWSTCPTLTTILDVAKAA